MFSWKSFDKKRESLSKQEEEIIVISDPKEIRRINHEIS